MSKLKSGTLSTMSSIKLFDFTIIENTKLYIQSQEIRPKLTESISQSKLMLPYKPWWEGHFWTQGNFKALALSLLEGRSASA